MDGLTPEARLLVAGLIVTNAVVVVLEVVRALNRGLDRRDWRRRNHAHPAEWDR